MILLQNYLDDYSKRADTENIKIKVLGDITALSEGLQKSINRAIEKTAENWKSTNKTVVIMQEVQLKIRKEHVVRTKSWAWEDIRKV